MCLNCFLPMFIANLCSCIWAFLLIIFREHASCFTKFIMDGKIPFSNEFTLMLTKNPYVYPQKLDHTKKLELIFCLSSILYNCYLQRISTKLFRDDKQIVI